MKKIFYLLVFLIATNSQINAQCWAKVSAGSLHTLALKNDGTMWAWGSNFSGCLGDGTNTIRTTPVQAGSASDWTSVFASTGSFSLALKSNGTLWAWGNNSFGQLGNGTNTDSYVPLQVGTDNDWLMISPGNDYVLALKTNLTLWAWGINNARQLGDGSTTNSSIPIQIGTDNDWTWVDAGYQTSLAIKSNGSIWAWGVNDNGIFGNGSSGTFSAVPLLVSTTNDWATLSASGHVMARKTDGTLWAWGSNSEGELGDGTTTGRLSPVQIGTDTDWEEVIAGGGFTMGLKNDGSRWYWGNNTFGQYGNGTFFPATIVPVQIPFPTDWEIISVSDVTAFGIRTGSDLWGWGGNAFGNIGIGTTANSAFPAQVNCNSVLPVTWLSVNGQLQNGNAIIQWATASENNSSHFEIEHSTNGVNYTKAGTINAAGFSSNTSDYSYTHIQPVAGKNYYRIKQVDRDGKFSYSRIITLINKKEQNILVVTPNPAQHIIQVNTNIGGPGTIRIYSIQGKLLQQQPVTPGNQQQHIDISKLPAGIYILQMQTSEFLKTKSFLKQ